MKRKDLKDDEFIKLSEDEKLELLVDFNLDPGDNISSPKSIEKHISEKLKIQGNLKIDDGFYYYESKLYLSIWSYKNFKKTDSPNNNSTNYNDAKSLFYDCFVTTTIRVHTHSDLFPTVNGYLEEDLDNFYLKLYDQKTGYERPCLSF